MNTSLPVEFEVYGSVPVTVTTTNANSKLHPLNPMPSKDVTPDLDDTLADWHYLVYIPGENASASGSKENPQLTSELGKVEAPTLNVYHCQSNGNNTSGGKDAGNGTGRINSKRFARLITSVPTNYLTSFDIATFYLGNPPEEQDPEEVRQNGPDPEVLAEGQRSYSELTPNSFGNVAISNLTQLIECVDSLLVAN